MEVNLVSKTGIPDSAILSIRSGAVKRQAPTTSDRPFRFAPGETKDNLLKFDILQCVGTGYAVLKPFEDRYNVVLSNDMACEVDIKHVGSSPITADKQPDVAKPTSTFSVQNAQSYLDEHGVLQFIQGMIQALVKERPSDPYKYMGRHILNGYDVEAKPPNRDSSSLKAVHEQARGTLTKLPGSGGAAVLERALSSGPPLCGKKPSAELPVLAKCAPPPQEEPRDLDQLRKKSKDLFVDKYSDTPQEANIDELRHKAKDLLVRGFHNGSLEQSLSNSNDQKKESVEALRSRAKGLFVQGFHSGSLEASLTAMHAKEVASADTGN